ncbi:unnamed protein product, partial [Vitis vinifera]
MTYNRNEDVSDEFDEYDPTPYGGGYDITVIYGRPLEPSEETCYPISSKSGDIDYDRPSYTSCSEPSAYGDEALENEYKSYARPKPLLVGRVSMDLGMGGSLITRNPVRSTDPGTVGSLNANSLARNMDLATVGSLNTNSLARNMDLGTVGSLNTNSLHGIWIWVRSEA